MGLQETRAETTTKIRSIQLNNHKNISIIEKQKITLTIKAYVDYVKIKSADNLLEYLLKIRNRYLGKLILFNFFFLNFQLI